MIYVRSINLYYSGFTHAHNLRGAGSDFTVAGSTHMAIHMGPLMTLTSTTMYAKTL